MIQDSTATGATPGKNNQDENASLYDLTMVRSVSGGDEGFIQKMVRLFIETVPPGLNELKEAAAASQWERVAKIAHKLKSTIDSMGIVSVKDDIRKVESIAKEQSDTGAVPAMVEKVDAVIQQCIGQLKHDFSI